MELLKFTHMGDPGHRGSHYIPSMKNWCFLLWILPALANAQVGFHDLVDWEEAQIDSLLSAPLSDSTRTFAQLCKARFYLTNETDTALIWLGQAMKLAQRIDHPYAIAKATYLTGYAYDLLGDYEQSGRLLLRAADLHLANNDVEDVGNVYNSLGVSNYFRGDQKTAVAWYTKAAEWWEANPGYDHLYGKVLNNMAILQRLQGQYEEAILTYQRAVACKYRMQDSSGAAVSISNMATAYVRLDQPKQALENLAEAREYFERHNDLENLASVDFTTGGCYLKLGEPKQAIPYLEAARSVYNRVDGHSQAMEVLLELSDAYNRTKRFEDALAIQAELAPLVNDETRDMVLLRFYQERQQTETGLKNYLTALETAVHIDSLRKALNLEERQREMQRLQTEFDVERKNFAIQEAELKLLQAEQREVSRRAWQIPLFIGLGMMVLTGIVVSWLTVRNNRRLAEKNQIIQRSLRDKEVLLKEIHHRVKNNLQLVSSLLSIQARSIEDENALAAVQESRNRVKSMALIHQNLYQEDNLTGIDIADYVDKLVPGLVGSYQTGTTQITWKADIEPLRLDLDTAIPIGLILNELITNSLKHAFDQLAQGEVQIEIARKGECLRLKVADNGKGMEGFDWDTPRASYGMKMLRAFAEKLKAKLVVNAEHGTEVSLDIYHFKVLPS